MKLISVMTACYNEEENVEELYRQAKEVFAGLPDYRYEHIFIDNASKDKTVAILKEIAKKDKNVKIVVNAKNFGHIRSPYHGLLQANGDAVISVVADLQDPPSMIAGFLRKWEEGYKIVIGIKKTSMENPLMFKLRQLYYNLIDRIAETEHIKNFTGFICAFLSLLVAIGYSIYKIIFWSEFQLGVAPLVVGFFFFMSVQLFFIGMVGEYIGTIYTQVKKRPLVVERERINF